MHQLTRGPRAWKDRLGSFTSERMADAGSETMGDAEYLLFRLRVTIAAAGLFPGHACTYVVEEC